MSLPSGVTAATLTVKAAVITPPSPNTISVEIVPSEDLTHAASDTSLSDMIEVLVEGPGLIPTFVVPHSSQSGFVDASGDAAPKWYYIATITTLAPGGTPASAPRSKAFRLPAGAGAVTVDLEALATHVPSPADEPTPPGPGIGITINTPATTPDIVTVTGANTPSGSFFGEGAFASVVTLTPTKDIDGILHFDMGPDFAAPNLDGGFYIFDFDPWLANGNQVVDVYNTDGDPSTAIKDVALTSGVTYYLAFIDWNPTPGRQLDRGPIINRLAAYGRDGILADDGMYLPHIRPDESLEWLRYPTPTGGFGSWAEGRATEASGPHSHAEGFESVASGLAAHAEGHGTQATGDNSHAEGNGSIASGHQSHAEGSSSATGAHSHAEGQAEASGERSHAEADGKAEGFGSHAQGSAVATTQYEDAMGHAWASRNAGPDANAGNLSATGGISVPIVMVDEDDDLCASLVKVTVMAFGPGRVVGVWDVTVVVVNDDGELRIIGTPNITALGDAGASTWTLSVVIPVGGPYPTIAVMGDTHGPLVRWQGFWTRDTCMAATQYDSLD